MELNYQQYLTERETPPKAAKKSGLWDLLTSMKFAIWLLIILGALSLISMFVGELRNPEAAQQPPSGSLDAMGRALMVLFQMADPFRSWWYRLLLAALSVSLFACLVERTPIIWRLWTKRPPSDASWLKSVRHGIVRLTSAPRETLARRLSGWSWRMKSDTLWIGERGRLGIWGPLITHLGLLLIAVGALVGSFGGVRERWGGFAGDVLSRADMPFAVRIDSFRVEYYPLQPGQWVLVDNEWLGKLASQQADGMWLVRPMGHEGQVTESLPVPAERIRNRFSNQMDRSNIQSYISYVTLLEGEREAERAQIMVNSPLRRSGFRFYQSSYEPDEPRVSASYESVRIALTDTAGKALDTLVLRPGAEIFVPGDTLRVSAGELLPDFKLGESGGYSESAEFNNPALRLVFRGPGGFEKQQWTFLRFAAHGSGPGRYNYRLVALSGEQATAEMMTIWEIKRTYGGELLWVGFTICTLGLFLSFYVMHRVLYVEWPVPPHSEVRLTGLSRKMSHLFARQLDHILHGLDVRSLEQEQVGNH